MPGLSLTLNGEQVEAEEGSTILEAASLNGVQIPTLCHDPRLTPYAACRICLVEVEGARGFMPACATTVQDGMVVRTKTDELSGIRQMALELLLSDHYGDCLAPCKLACPAGIDIQGYVALVANGMYSEAVKLIKRSNPLPLVCGRVCPRFCEAKCRRNLVDEPVAINALKRFAADYDLSHGGPHVPQPGPPTGRRVAIVGGGPAGLSAAYFLALEGHEVTIFEASPQLGGMLRYGIPEYRLPKATLDEEIAAITNLCHQVHCGVALGQDFTIESLKRDGYEAVFVGMGAQASQRMGVDGEDLGDVLSGIGFLRDVALHKEASLGSRVAIVGGGNTAIDAARTAVRLGADEVTIVYRRSREEMPASDEEIEGAEEEGVKLQFLAAPVKLTAHNGKSVSMECTRMALGEPDNSGRRRPEPIPGSEFTIDTDTVIAAIGQNVDTSVISRDGQMEVDRRGCVVAGAAMETSVEGVFAGGDCVSGPATVVQAVGAGKKAALAIGRYLNGQQVAPVPEPYNCSKGELDEIDVSDYRDVERMPRTPLPALNPWQRKGNFAEVELTFTEEMAKREAERCLACGCQDVFECKLRQLATECGIRGDRYAGRRRHIPIRKYDHPHINIDPNKCVLCGRCVRMCSEVQGVGALGFIGRGFDTLVRPSLNMPLQETTCESCGQCVSTCPTGALTAKVQLPKSGPWQTEAVPSVCPYCGIGCNVELNVMGDRVITVTSSIGSAVNNGNLCKKGAFGYRSTQSAKRLGLPRIKRNGHLVEATWDEAIRFAGEGLNRIKETKGGKALAALASPQGTNEENYLLQKFARLVLRTNNISSLGPPASTESLAKSLGANASTCSYNDILASDLIFLFGCDVSEDYPIIALRIREAVDKGCKLVAINPRVTRIAPLAAIALRINPRMSASLLKAVLGYVISYDLVDWDFIRSHTTGFDDFAEEMKEYRLEDMAEALWANPARIVELVHMYVRARNPVIVVDADRTAARELTLMSDLALITGNLGRPGAGMVALRGAGNAQGLIDMGVNPYLLPGQQAQDAAARRKFEEAWQGSLPSEDGMSGAEIAEGLTKGEIEGVLVVGVGIEDGLKTPVLESSAFTVLVDTVAPEKPPYPDVILPGSTFAETQGSFTNCERRIQQVRRAVPSPSGKENWEIISALADALGCPMDYSSPSAISAEIADLAPIFAVYPPANQWTFLEDGRFRRKDGLAGLRLA